MNAFQHVGDERVSTGNDVRVDFEPRAGHADRIAHAVVSVHRELARQGMDDLPVGADVDQLRGIHDAPHVAPHDFTLFARNGDDATIVRALNVLAGNTDVDVRDVDARHSFGPLGCRLDRADRLFEIRDDAFAQTR